MKKVLTILIAFVIVFVVFYFTMWYLLGQVPVIKIRPYVAKIDKSISNNLENFPAVFKEIQTSFAAEYKEHVKPKNRSRNGFYPTLQDIISDYDYQMKDWDTYSHEKKLSLVFSFWGEFINLALSRAEYNSKTVPLGAMKDVLSSYIAAYEKNKSVLNALPDDLYKTVEKDYRTYVSLLEDPETILIAYLKSGDARKIKIVCQETADKKLVGMKEPLVSIFNTASDADLKYIIAKTLLSIQYADPQFDNYIMDKLKESFDTPEFYDLISLIGSSGNSNYIKPLEALMPSVSEDIQDSLKNAIVKIKG